MQYSSTRNLHTKFENKISPEERLFSAAEKNPIGALVVKLVILTLCWCIFKESS
jgi:hypothetical protein